jgi:hypothetical protein
MRRSERTGSPSQFLDHCPPSGGEPDSALGESLADGAISVAAVDGVIHIDNRIELRLILILM